MSMYTQLLATALQRRAADPAERGPTLAEVRRCRTQLEQGTRRSDPDEVSAALALHIGYDIALLRLTGLVGIDSEPEFFDPPLQERSRLEDALAALGLAITSSSGRQNGLSGTGP
jgi:hypothetical protein